MAEAIELRDVHVERLGVGPVLRQIHWTIHPGDAWAIIGANGSGKTTLAEVLLGRHRITAGSIHGLIEPSATRTTRANYPAGGIRLVSFKEESRLDETRSSSARTSKGFLVSGTRVTSSRTKFKKTISKYRRFTA